MKKIIISTILAAAMLLACLTAAFAARPGDMDADSKVTASDARTVLRAAVGLDVLTPEQFAAADADHDNKITASDARLVLRVSVGLDALNEDPAAFLAADADGGGVEVAQLGEALLESGELAQQHIVFVILDGGIVQHVVAVAVIVQRRGQVVYSLFGFGSVHKTPLFVTGLIYEAIIS